MKQVKVIEKNDQRVLTSAQLAEQLQTDSKTISYNFNYNRSRYEEGNHYIALTGEERKNFLSNYPEIQDSSTKHAKVVYLWTKKGAFLHAKSLNTDKAWEAYSELVDDYFNKVEMMNGYGMQPVVPTTIEGILELAVLNMKDLRTKLDKVEEDNRRLQLVVDNEIFLTEHQKADIQDAVIDRTHSLRRKGYDAHYQSIYRALKSHFSVSKYDKILRKDFENAMDLIKGWYPKKKEEV